MFEELQKTGSYSEDEGTGLISKGIFSGMLARLENLTGTLYWRISALHLNYVKIPHDIAKAVDYFTDGKGLLHFGKMLGILLVIFAASFGVEKFIGIVMTVMVTLIVLSSMGINIGPLLAGAGVAGLAIGFGAQKLVADVLSGIFYLVDDAFRVGEYIQAGSVSGSVEAITLRNVMLRHHRGMLQIIPLSDLGSITNFMRGGIVIKFNLQFPYDTNIDKVRKVIKKVGQQMLDDPEMGPDFIQPVKSGGVREMGDSVMTIRVKFTANPGAHFVIRREAYKRITEAMEARGIHYAHRKVIVEVSQGDGAPATGSSQPAENDSGSDNEGQSIDQAIKAAAAAAASESVLKKEPDKQPKD